MRWVASICSVVFAAALVAGCGFEDPFDDWPDNESQGESTENSGEEDDSDRRPGGGAEEQPRGTTGGDESDDHPDDTDHGHDESVGQCLDLSERYCSFDCTDVWTWSDQWFDDVNEVVALTNDVRTSGTTCNGVNMPPVEPLEIDLMLEQAASCHSEDMAVHDYFSHTGSNGSSVGDRARDAGYDWMLIGENIAVGHQTPRAVVDGWLASTAGHCEAIMNPDYQHLGVGLVVDSGVPYWTQNFGATSWD